MNYFVLFQALTFETRSHYVAQNSFKLSDLLVILSFKVAGGRPSLAGRTLIISLSSEGQ